jgi:hypothetical protein
MRYQPTSTKLPVFIPMNPSLTQITPHDLEVLSDSKHWRERAQAARGQAEMMTNEIAKKTMEGVIATYEGLALAAEGN